MSTTEEKFKLAGLEMKYFIPISIILIIAVFLGKLPSCIKFLDRWKGRDLNFP